jgi:hypothetical protein
MGERHALLSCMIQEKIFARLNGLTEEEINRMTFDQLATLAKVSESIERRARGEPDSILKSQSRNEHTGPGGGPVVVEVIETVVRSRQEVRQVMANPEAELLMG